MRNMNFQSAYNQVSIELRRGGNVYAVVSTKLTLHAPTNFSLQKDERQCIFMCKINFTFFVISGRERNDLSACFWNIYQSSP
jgi:hypothetical protein